MKRLIAVMTLMIFGTGLFAQDDEDIGDKKSNEIIDRVITKTEAYKSFKAEFIHVMKNAEAGIDESNEGELYVMGDKYRLKIAGQLVICNGATSWTYIPDAGEVQINSVEDTDEAITPANLLTSYNKDYKSKFIRESFQYGTTVNIIDLTPAEGKSYYKVRLIIDKGKEQILEITIFDKNGSTYSYIVNKFEPNVDVKESDFTFNPADYPDVDVVDMR
ncbi:MAG: outer membrane lipoprotein carrier protein LolA [Bacteroidales bacterium]|nr:outer membrane lipoprotein carrier protein LolA [Bacteroidales bacterium]